MSSHFVFNGVDDAVKARIESYWAKKLPRLQKLLTAYPADLQEIRLTVSQHRKDSSHRWYELRGVVELPTGTLAAEAHDVDPQVALDRVADALVSEIRRHRELVRHDYVFKRKARRRADLSAAGPMLQEDAGQGRREDFLRLLRPHLRSLRALARRELRRMELAGLLHRGEVTVDDLLDEVLVRAWEQFADRPQRLRLDLWLVNLLYDTLEHWVKEEPRPHASLDDKVAEVPRQDEPDWLAELWDDAETFTLGDLILDAEETEAWEQLEPDEQRDRLLSLLNGLPPAQRQAFLLHVLEGYSTAEIAMLQDRPESQVIADIARVRQTLRDRLMAAGFVKNGGQPAAVASPAGEMAAH